MKSGRRKIASFVMLAALALPACNSDDAAEEETTEETTDTSADVEETTP